MTSLRSGVKLGLMKDNYTIKGIKHFLPGYIEGDDEDLYYSFSSFDALKDRKNLDYIGFWQPQTFWGGDTGFAKCLSANKPYGYKQRKNLRKRTNNIFTLTSGEDRTQPNLVKIYYNKKISKFYFFYSSYYYSNSDIRKILKFKKKKIIDKFKVKNNKFAIFCLSYLQNDLEEMFWQIINEKMLNKNFGIKSVDDASENQFSKIKKLIEKQKIYFTEKQINKLNPKDKKNLIEYMLMSVSSKNIYEVPNGNYVVSFINSYDIDSDEPYGYLVELV